MKQPSFRLQITLLSSALAGIALIGFGAISWWQIYRAKINRLDAQIVNILMRGKGPPETEASKLYQEQRWQLYANSLTDILGGSTNKISSGLLVLDTTGNLLYQSQEIAEDPSLYQQSIEQLALTESPPQISPQTRERKIAPPPPTTSCLSNKN
ncbi:MAG: hypothetical protein AAFO95_20870 [Cyanobacteria bacterium J06600_6]